MKYACLSRLEEPLLLCQEFPPGDTSSSHLDEQALFFFFPFSSHHFSKIISISLGYNICESCFISSCFCHMLVTWFGVCWTSKRQQWQPCLSRVQMFLVLSLGWAGGFPAAGRPGVSRKALEFNIIFLAMVCFLYSFRLFFWNKWISLEWVFSVYLTKHEGEKSNHHSGVALNSCFTFFLIENLECTWSSSGKSIGQIWIGLLLFGSALLCCLHWRQFRVSFIA